MSRIKIENLQKYLKDNIKLFALIKYSENNNRYRQRIAGSILGKNMVVKIYKSNYVTESNFDLRLNCNCENMEQLPVY